MVIFLNIPALVVIALCYLWIGLNEMAAIAAAALLQARSGTSVSPADLRWGADIRGRKPISMGRIAELDAWFRANPGGEDTLPGQLRGGAPAREWARQIIAGMDADLDGVPDSEGTSDKPLDIAATM